MGNYSLSSFTYRETAKQNRWATDWERRCCLQRGYDAPVCSHLGYTHEQRQACVEAQLAAIAAREETE
jgi:hypothetical protein